jgi:2-octaprenylphenol hydroxylase
VADAAHTIHPLAGQGINLGFADVAVLAAELARAWDGGQDLGSMMVLERYQRRRKSENIAAMAAMEGFVQLFDRPEPLVRWARNVGMTTFDRFQPLKQAVARLAMGIA